MTTRVKPVKAGDKRQEYTKTKAFAQLSIDGQENSSEGIEAISLTSALKLLNLLVDGKLMSKEEKASATRLKKELKANPTPEQKEGLADLLYSALKIAKSLPIGQRMKLMPETEKLETDEGISVEKTLSFADKVNGFISLMELTEGYLLERTLEETEIDHDHIVEFTGKGQACVLCRKPAKLVTDGTQYQVKCTNCENHSRAEDTPETAKANWLLLRNEQEFLTN